MKSLRPPALLLFAVLVVLSACTSSKDVKKEMEAGVKDHHGAWTESELREAAGKYSGDIVRVEATPDGGTVVFELSHTNGGYRYTGSGHRRHRTHRDYTVDCLEITVSGSTIASSRDYTERDYSHSPDC